MLPLYTYTLNEKSLIPNFQYGGGQIPSIHILRLSAVTRSVLQCVSDKITYVGDHPVRAEAVW